VGLTGCRTATSPARGCGWGPAHERCCCRRSVATAVCGNHNTSKRRVHSQRSQRFVHEVTQETLLCQLPGVRRGLIVSHCMACQGDHEAEQGVQ
jgi:hypothetical protein